MLWLKIGLMSFAPLCASCLFVWLVLRREPVAAAWRDTFLAIGAYVLLNAISFAVAIGLVVRLWHSERESVTKKTWTVALLMLSPVAVPAYLWSEARRSKADSST